MHDPLLSLRDLRCRAPSAQNPDGRCPQLLDPSARDNTLYCSGRCRARASRARRRRDREPALRILLALQEGRPQRLQEHPHLVALARLRAAQRLVELAPPLPARAPQPRTFEGKVPALDRLGSMSEIPKEGRYVGIEVLPLKEGEFLIVTVLA